MKNTKKSASGKSEEKESKNKVSKTDFDILVNGVVKFKARQEDDEEAHWVLYVIKNNKSILHRIDRAPTVDVLLEYVNSGKYDALEKYENAELVTQKSQVVKKISISRQLITSLKTIGLILRQKKDENQKAP